MWLLVVAARSSLASPPKHRHLTRTLNTHARTFRGVRHQVAVVDVRLQLAVRARVFALQLVVASGQLDPVAANNLMGRREESQGKRTEAYVQE